MGGIIAWSRVESFMLDIYLAMLGGPNDSAGIAFLALETQGPRSAVIEAVARERLGEQEREILHALLKKVKAAQKTRNKLAHWNWGYSPQLPDYFVLVDPREATRVLDPGAPPGSGKQYDKFLAFDASDFEGLIQDCELICGIARRLLFIVQGYSTNQDGALIQKLRQELGL